MTTQLWFRTVVDCKLQPPGDGWVDYCCRETPNVRNGRFVREGLRFTDRDSRFAECDSKSDRQIGDVLITSGGATWVKCASFDRDLRVCLGQRTDAAYSPTRQCRHWLPTSCSTCVWRRRRSSRTQLAGSSVGHARIADIRRPPNSVCRPESRTKSHRDGLSDVDALVGSLERLIAKKCDLKQAAMQQLLTGRTRLPGFHGEWEVKSLFDLAETQEGAFRRWRLD